jgi:SAM-dependent methyltransferase
MYDETADIYDLIYARIRDRESEAARVATVIRDRYQNARDILDVACGTGERARRLSTEYGFNVDGIDLAADMLEQARSKNTSGCFTQEDMVEFDLGRTYDVVLSLFSSIGYVCTTDRLFAAVAAMGRHVASDGLLIIEPWLEPSVIEDGRVSTTTAGRDGLSVCRMAHTRVDGRMSLVRFEYLIGNSDGLRRASEVHKMGLFTRDEMLSSLRAAGFAADFDPDGIAGRGLYVACRG